MTIYLDPANPATRDLIGRSVAETDPKKAIEVLSIRCRQKHHHIGSVIRTPFGLGFASSWTVDRPASASIDGRQIGQRELDDVLDRVFGAARLVSGPPIRRDDVHGVVALLDLPPALGDDYPALLVRCEHGDAVLERSDVISRAKGRRPEKWTVDVGKPFTDYTFHDPSAGWLPASRTTRSREVRGGSPFTPGGPG